MEEQGESDHVTNLPMEMLFKMKLEEKIAKQMLAEDKTAADAGLEIPSLSSQPVSGEIPVSPRGG